MFRIALIDAITVIQAECMCMNEPSLRLDRAKGRLRMPLAANDWN